MFYSCNVFTLLLCCDVQDRRISVLDDKCRLYQKVNSEETHSPRYVTDLESRCLSLQKQISEMEVLPDSSISMLIFIGAAIIFVLILFLRILNKYYQNELFLKAYHIETILEVEST